MTTFKHIARAEIWVCKVEIEILDRKCRIVEAMTSYVWTRPSSKPLYIHLSSRSRVYLTGMSFLVLLSKGHPSRRVAKFFHTNLMRSINAQHCSKQSFCIQRREIIHGFWMKIGQILINNSDGCFGFIWKEMTILIYTGSFKYTWQQYYREVATTPTPIFGSLP